MTGTCQLVLLVREPRPGRTKTRLGREIGHTAAAWWARHQTGRMIRRLGGDPRWRLVLAVSPDTALRSPVWAHPHRVAQGRGDLGARMARLFRRLPPGPLMIIGSDIPGIERRHIARGFALLGRHEAVLGPSPDGGFWMIGLRRGAQAIPCTLFEGVRWSTAAACADTAESLAPLSVGYADTLADVDTAEDLARFCPGWGAPRM